MRFESMGGSSPVVCGAVADLITGRLNLLSFVQVAGHPNVLALRDVIEDTHRIHLITEFCAGGSLADVSEPGPMSWNVSPDG